MQLQRSFGTLSLHQRKCYTCCRILFSSKPLINKIVRNVSMLWFGMMNAYYQTKIHTNKKET